MALYKINNSLELLEEVVKTSKSIGSHKVVEVLRQLRKTESTSNIKDKQEIIINEVLVDFSLSITKIKSNKGDTRHARMFCYVLLKRHLCMDANEIGRFFKRSGQRVYEEINVFNRFNTKYATEASLIKKFSALEEKILAKINP